MKLLFVHDHPFYAEKHEIFSGGGLPCEIWNNYFINFNHIVVYARKSNNLKDKKVLSSSENVSFLLTENYTSSIKLLKNIYKISGEIDLLLNGIDVVLIRLPSILGFIAGKVAIKRNKPIWVEQVGSAKDAMLNHGSILGKLVAPFFEYVNKKIVKKSSFVSYVTLNKLQSQYPPRPESISVSLSDVNIQSIITIKRDNKSRFCSKELKIGLIGGFDAKYKGQDVLLKAIALLDSTVRSNISLYFIGKGDYSWVMQVAKNLQIDKQIKFIGPLKAGNEVNDLLKTLSLYIQPSLTEGMPRALIEAMAMGCPVLGSNVGGIPDVVSSRFIHKKGDFKELSLQINYLCNKRETLLKEAQLSLKKASPYLKEELDKKRKEFYREMNDFLKL